MFEKNSFLYGIILVAIGLFIAVNIPWSEKNGLYEMIIKLTIFIIVFSGFWIGYYGSKRKTQKEYEGKPLTYLPVGRKYRILCINQILAAKMTYMLLSPAERKGKRLLSFEIISFAREVNDLPVGLKSGMIIAQTQDFEIYIAK